MFKNLALKAVGAFVVCGLLSFVISHSLADWGLFFFAVTVLMPANWIVLISVKFNTLAARALASSKVLAIKAAGAFLIIVFIRSLISLPLSNTVIMFLLLTLLVSADWHLKVKERLNS